MAGLSKKRRHKLSYKIGASFLTMMVAIELGLFISLYLLVFNTYVKQEVDNLVVRGDNYARVLAVDFSSSMVRHSVLAGVDNSTAMVVQNASNQTTLDSSQTVTSEMRQHIQEFQKSNSNTSQSLHTHLFRDDYIVSMSPVKSDGKVIGRIYMFLDTHHIRQILFDFTGIFAVLALLTIFLTVLSAFYISRFITRPLLLIKNGAQKIALGDLSLALNINSQDELSDLATAIENLASNLNTMKKSRNEFLASVAHELRTPLTFIKGYADIAARPSSSDAQKAEYLIIIREETDRLSALTDDLMTLAQLEENEFKIRKASVIVSKIIEQAVSKMSPILAQKNIQIALSGNSDFVAALDETRIEQVLVNLLMNAYKYSFEKSTITLSISSDDNLFHIKIADNGEGIPDEELTHIFERFYRVDKSRSRKTGGAGLGLAIVQDIIKLHGGTISVQSKIGSGTSFEITLPYE